jgi:hypothetical protein
MIEKKTLDFYNKNKDCQWICAPIPDHLLTIIDQAQWILKEAKLGWIELDLHIDVESWKKDLQTVSDYLIPHREDNNSGWNSCCLHGIDIEKTGAWTNYGYTREEDVPYRWTALSNNTLSVTDFWKETFPTDSYRRIRVMELEPNCAITPHSDMPGRLPGEDNFNALSFGIPINVAVVHPSDCFMVLEDYGVVPFREGQAFIVNIRQTHTVVNFSNKPRLHIIGHSYGYGSKLNEFADLVVRSYNKQVIRSASRA